MKPDARDDLGPPITVRRQRTERDGRSVRLVTHQLSVVSLCVEGTATVEMGGQWTVSAGDVVIIPAGAPHRLSRKGLLDLVSVGLCVPCLTRTITLDLFAPLERTRAGGAPVVTIPGDRRPWLHSVLAELERAIEASANVPAAVAMGLVAVLLNEVQHASSALPDGSSPGGLAQQALRVIEARCLGPLTLAEVAKAVHRSPAHVTTVVSKETGRSVGDWIAAFRLAESRRLLFHGDDGVDVVAERVGYQDVSHFIRMFRREHGVTPAAWRKQARQHRHPR